MFLEILTFMAAHKVIIIGATTTFAEVVVVLFNLWRRLRSPHTELMSSDQKSVTFKTILWAANPINLFKQPY